MTRHVQQPSDGRREIRRRQSPWASGILSFVLWAALAAPGFAQVGSKSGEMPANFRASTFEGMPFRLWVPKDYDTSRKYPLTLCLHGAGGRGEDNRGRGTEAAVVLTSDSVQEKHPSFVLVPQCPKDGQWVDTPWEKGSYRLETVPLSDDLDTALRILRKVVEEYSIDPERVYVTGQSMGGYGTWDAILRHPELFAAAVPVCGGGDPTQADRIRSLPIRSFHGSNDKVVPVEASRQMHAALQQLDAPATYTEIEGGGHAIWTRAWRSEGLVDWLFAQKRK